MLLRRELLRQMFIHIATSNGEGFGEIGDEAGMIGSGAPVIETVREMNRDWRPDSKHLGPARDGRRASRGR